VKPTPPLPRLRFSKMHGTGNDFVLVDRRAQAEPLARAWITWLADRRRGVGCDQLLTIEPPRSAGAALAYRIWNSDGSAAGQCGNGARCVAAWARRAGIVAGEPFVMDSPAGPVAVRFVGDEVEVELGRPSFAPAAVPYLGGADDGELDDGARRLRFAVVSLGNPHAVLEVASADEAEVERIGRALQADPRFPDACNVGFAEVRGRDRIRLRVFERGVGETLACGSGACAAVAVLARRGRVGDDVAVELPGGVLGIRWAGGDAPMAMRGPAEFVFEGEIDE
jgi:diaminopimelate epimerase